LRGEPVVRDNGHDDPGNKTREAARRSSVPSAGVKGQPGFGGPEPQAGA
jgi:hypothetical protein